MARVSPARIGRWSIRRPWLAIGAWLAFVVLCVALGAVTGTKTLSNGAVGESARGYSVMDANDLWGPPRELAYLHSDTAAVASPGFASAIRDVRRRFAGLGLRTSTTASADGHSAIVVAAIDRPVPLERIQATVAAAARAHAGVAIAETGDLSADQARQDVVDRDLHRAELLAIPVTLLVLLVAFGSLVAALVPLLLGLSAVAAGLGLLGPLSQAFPVQDSAKTVILLIGLAVGVDYALFYVVRSREERRRRPPHEAVEVAAGTSGRTVLVSGTTVALAMAGMFVVGAKVLNGIAAGTIAVVACAVAGSVTVLPAVLELLGPRIERGVIPFLPAFVRPGGGRVWSAVATRVLRRPLLAACLSAGLLVGLGVPALSLHVAKPSDLALTSQDVPALRTLDDVRRAFPQSGEPALVTVRVPPSSTGAATTQLRRLRSLALRSGLAHPPAAIRTIADRTAAVLELPLAGNGANHASRDAVDTLRRTLVPETLGRVAGAQVAVTGQTAEDVDFTDQIRSSLPFVIGFVLSLAFCVLLVAFRSVVVPLKAVVLNLLSVGAAYGVLALVFEHHWAQPLLGFRSNGTIVAWLPLFLFVVLFGLSMDYHVFVLSRVREAVDRGRSTPDALRESIGATAGVVTAAALVMVCVFSLFGTLSSLDLKQAGVGLAVAILLDATVVRAVLLPASMALLGEWNWYLPKRPRGLGTRPTVVERHARPLTRREELE
ncbi:MAG TPA: MMPL family transporter [Gaiella sp.]|nr:MMPL family transporter [Gaiella sp.]